MAKIRIPSERSEESATISVQRILKIEQTRTRLDQGLQTPDLQRSRVRLSQHFHQSEHPMHEQEAK